MTLRLTSNASWSYHPQTNQLTVELSQLGERVPNPMPQELEVKSHRTGDTLLFVLDSIDREDEGDICGWHYRPRIPGKHWKLKLLIIND